MARFRPAFIVVVVTIVAAACGGSSADTTSTDGSQVVLGRGTVPQTVPESFPIPEEVVVGATLIDPTRGITEMILTFPADTPAVVDYYEQNLPPRGYTIASSGGSETEWRIDFSDDAVSGVVSVQTGGSGVAAAAVQFTER